MGADIDIDMGMDVDIEIENKIEMEISGILWLVKSVKERRNAPRRSIRT